jgi:hypothetical protein
MVICHFWVSTGKITTDYQFSRIVSGGFSWPLGPAGKLFLAGEKKKNLDHPDSFY